MRGDLAADFLDGLGRQALENLRRLVLLKREQQDRGFSDAVEFGSHRFIAECDC